MRRLAAVVLLREVIGGGRGRAMEGVQGRVMMASYNLHVSSQPYTPTRLLTTRLASPSPPTHNLTSLVKPSPPTHRWQSPAVFNVHVKSFPSSSQMAEQSPAVFNVHVKAFLDAIWFPLRDPKLHMRDMAVQVREMQLQGQAAGSRSGCRDAGSG